MDKKAIQQELMNAARSCSMRQMQTNNGGNLSARYSDDSMIVKASKSSFSNCGIEDFVVSDFSGNLLEGTRNPSKESILHGKIYSKFSRVGAIVHCHSPYATAFASGNKSLVFSTYHSEIKLKEEVKVFDTESYYVSEEDAERIMSEYEKESLFTAFLLKGHGQVAVGETVEEALWTAELIEETAKIHILSNIALK